MVYTLSPLHSIIVWEENRFPQKKILYFELARNLKTYIDVFGIIKTLM